MKADILPVVTSSDINAYSMARAFHEAYGVKSLMIARKISGTIDYSKILDFRCEPNLTDDKVFMDTLRGIYEEFKDQYKHIIILGCTDHYVRLIVAHKKELSKMFVVPYADQKVLDNLILKELSGYEDFQERRRSKEGVGRLPLPDYFKTFRLGGLLCT